MLLLSMWRPLVWGVRGADWSTERSRERVRRRRFPLPRCSASTPKSGMPRPVPSVHGACLTHARSETQVLVLSPTRELAQQIQKVCPAAVLASWVLVLLFCGVFVCLLVARNQPREQVVLALGDYMNVQCHASIGGQSIGEDIRKLDYGQVCNAASLVLLHDWRVAQRVLWAVNKQAVAQFCFWNNHCGVSWVVAAPFSSPRYGVR